MSEVCSPAVVDGRSIFRHGAQDVLFVGLLMLHGAALAVWPTVWTVAIGLWWNSNTISHNFIHRPFFRSRWCNVLFSSLLSLVLGYPQSIWRDRHLAHHAGSRVRIRRTPRLWLEILLVTTLWTSLAWMAPTFLLGVYAPGFLLGLLFCAVHGHYEHSGGTTSHYGRIYNLLFLNDGYHVEHHASPATHWRLLPRQAEDLTAGSRWPAILRCLDSPLDSLERLVLCSRLLQRFVLATHRCAWRQLLQAVGPAERPTRVGIVGGGLFPRTAVILAEELPEAELTIIDASQQNLLRGARMLAQAGLSRRVRTINEWFDPRRHDAFDLLVFPLAYRGSKSELRRRLPSRMVVFHDWLWDLSGTSRVVSWLLLKRMSLHRR